MTIIEIFKGVRAIASLANLKKSPENENCQSLYNLIFPFQNANATSWFNYDSQLKMRRSLITLNLTK